MRHVRPRRFTIIRFFIAAAGSHYLFRFKNFGSGIEYYFAETPKVIDYGWDFYF